MWKLSEPGPRQGGRGHPRPLRQQPEHHARHDWTEAELADAWEWRLYRAHWLVDCCERHLRVVFPGRRWGGPGPDFRGAVLAEASGRLIRGDVEVHLAASSWAVHRHAQDPAYAQVVLHVVARADAMVLDARGGHVPTVELEPERGPPAWPRRLERGPCVRAVPAVVGVVEAAGRERFRARAARFEGDLAFAQADQVLWRGVCEALGIKRNTAPFGQLAEAVPWCQAAQVVAERGPVGLAGLLLGTAGLLSEATLPEVHAWRGLQRTLGCRPALSVSSWDRGQLRAGNAPARRCRGLAELAARWTAERWRGPAEQLLEAVAVETRARRPRLWCLVHAAPWIGRGRAQVVAINVLLPFAAAAGVSGAADLFERLPGEPTNRIVRYMAQQLGQSSNLRFRGACQQQGLLHLFKTTCAARVCERCPAQRGARGARVATSAVAATSSS